jgi:Eukaryotic DNA topoisomerase I, catalytic core
MEKFSNAIQFYVLCVKESKALLFHYFVYHSLVSKWCSKLKALYSSCADKLPVAFKMLTFNRANREVALLCNHRRTVPKKFGKQMENLHAQVSDNL